MCTDKTLRRSFVRTKGYNDSNNEHEHRLRKGAWRVSTQRLFEAALDHFDFSIIRRIFDANSMLQYAVVIFTAFAVSVFTGIRISRFLSSDLN